jgi:hypothetical protein
MIAQLNNSNNNKCRHRWSEQKIHRSSFPIEMGMPLQLVLLLESGRYVPPNPERCLDKQCYCKSAANSEKAGNPHISCLWGHREVQMCRKPVGGGKKIAHRSNAFPL